MGGRKGTEWVGMKFSLKEPRLGSSLGIRTRAMVFLWKLGMLTPTVVRVEQMEGGMTERMNEYCQYTL